MSIFNVKEVCSLAVSSAWGYPKANVDKASADLALVFSHCDKVIYMLQNIQSYINLVEYMNSMKGSKDVVDGQSLRKDCRKLNLKLMFLLSFARYHYSMFPVADRKIFDPLLQS